MAVVRPGMVGTEQPPKQQDRPRPIVVPRDGGPLRERATDPDAAEEIISKHYLPNRLDVLDSTSLDMELAGLRVGRMTTGRLSYGHEVRQLTDAARDFHVNMPVRGHALSASGDSDPVRTAVGQAAVFSPEAPAEIVWSPDCVQLCLMIPRAALETELEQLLGRSVRSRLRFDFGVAGAPGAGRLRSMLSLVAQELEQPTGLATSQVAARHLEGLVMDGLLLGQSHNYSEGALGSARTAPTGIIRRGVEVVEGRAGEPWTTVSLAAELHLSVRALQAGFKREVGMSPMAFLRMVRLRRAHAALKEADPAETTVHAVAVGLGLLHQGRFARDYRALFGETPSQTLRH